jgi:hypothetical protein
MSVARPVTLFRDAGLSVVVPVSMTVARTVYGPFPNSRTRVQDLQDAVKGVAVMEFTQN